MIEKDRVWKVKTKLIPVMIQATGIISKSLRKYPSKISENLN
jgi:hypothetical protein